MELLNVRCQQFHNTQQSHAAQIGQLTQTHEAQVNRLIEEREAQVNQLTQAHEARLDTKLQECFSSEKSVSDSFIFTFTDERTQETSITVNTVVSAVVAAGSLGLFFGQAASSQSAVLVAFISHFLELFAEFCAWDKLADEKPVCKITSKTWKKA